MRKFVAYAQRARTRMVEIFTAHVPTGSGKSQMRAGDVHIENPAASRPRHCPCCGAAVRDVNGQMSCTECTWKETR